MGLDGSILQSVEAPGLGVGLDGGYVAPEPATLALLAAGGLAGLAAVRRRRSGTK